MLTREKLRQYQTADITACEAGALPDIREAAINQEEPLFQRLDSLTAQIGNPYLFRVGDVVVKIECSNGKPFADALACVFSPKV